jgi:8-oxo-dGTP pyrophosphatase MutT (NUDIX family)
MPGASILPVALYKNKLYFLFGKENPFEDSAKGFSDFGGGIEPGETAFETALREGSEEMTGFLGTNIELKKRLRKTGVYKINYRFNDTLDVDSSNKNTYIVHVFPFPYDTGLVKYFNNNHSFLWNKMDTKMLNDSKLFEKIEIDWFCEDDLPKRISEYRPFYADIVKEIIQHKAKIRLFMKKSIPKMQTKRRNKYSHKMTNSFASTRKRSSLPKM